jgi:hypothetical protein
VLFAIVNANYEFIYVHTGTNGRVSDGGIWSNTGIYKRLQSKQLKIPSPIKLPHGDTAVPYVFIGDEAFPLMENLMKPYSQRNITHDEKMFNYRLSRARRVVENAFGILASRFRVFLTPISINVSNVDAVVLACCALHNFLRKISTKNYITDSLLDHEDHVNGLVVPGEWRPIGNMLSLKKARLTNASTSAKIVRDAYRTYFNSNGKVSFQENMIS